MSWTSEKVEKLKELWSKGHTASQIAEALGDTTRNAVIGKAHRLNLEARAPSKQSNSSKSRENRQVMKRSPAPMSRKAKFQSILLDKNFEAENPKSLEELTDTTCKYMEGHPDQKDSSFCGRKTVEKYSYCPLHMLIVWQTRDRKDELLDKEEEVPKFIEKKIKSA